MVYRILFSVLALAMIFAGGCGLNRSIQAPKASVVAVKVADKTADGARLEIMVQLENPNDVALPLKRVDYRVIVDGIGSFTFRDDPNRTLPAKLPGTRQDSKGNIRPHFLHLYAGIKTKDANLQGKIYKATGTITYEPPGEIRKLLTDSHIPLPITSFIGSGTLQ